MKNSQITSEFDESAKNYDAVFTHSKIGVLQRKRVYDWLDKLTFFENKKQVYEINCGTGFDAVAFAKKGHTVIATDASIEMIKAAKDRQVLGTEFYQLKFNELKENDDFKKSEVLFSNFGGLNCISHNELEEFISQVASVQKQSDLFIGVIMGKHCFMEDLYHFLKLDLKKIGRRNTSGGLKVTLDGGPIQTYYHSPAELKELLENDYKICLIKPIAIFLPPSYLEPFFVKFPFWLRILNTLERLFGRISKLSRFADHYIIVAEKK